MDRDRVWEGEGPETTKKGVLEVSRAAEAEQQESGNTEVCGDAGLLRCCPGE